MDAKKMENVIKKLRKKGLIEKRKSLLLEMMDYDFSNPQDCMDYLAQSLLNQLTEYMASEGLTRSALAKKLGISRQAVSKMFAGDTSSISWMVKAILSLGGHVNLQTYLPTHGKKSSKKKSFSVKVTAGSRL